MKTNRCLILVVSLFLGSFAVSYAQISEEELAKIAQNPLANLISFPFQNNTNIDVGPFDRTQNITNFQPVIPLAEGKIIARVIVPFIRQPEIFSESGSKSGIGDISLSAFYTSNKGKVSWGAGPAINIPTAAQNLGIKEWGIGPSFVAVIKPGSWVIGTLINNTWSLESDQSTFLIQPFINFNLPEGYYLSTAPGITANWKAQSGEMWTIPIGLAFGKVIKPKGFLPLNIQVGAYFNLEKPEVLGSDWTLRIAITFLVPKAILKGSKKNAKS